MNPTSNHTFPGRSYFKPSGRVEWGSFILWLLVPLGVAAVMAMVLCWLFMVGHYYVAIVPAIAALAVAACLKLAVNKGHCRSRLVAGVVGLGAGVLLYLGYYYCGMVYQAGPRVAGRWELLPRYIRFRIRHDVVRDVNDSRKDDAPRAGDRWMNWFTFGLESVIVLAFTVGGAVGRAKKPYCEACHQWLRREVTHFGPAKAPDLLEAFRNGSARTLGALAAQPVFATVPSALLAMDYCPSLKEGSSRDCPSYVSLKLITRAGANAPVLDPFDSAQGKVLLRGLVLSADEAAALGGRFAVLGQVAGRAAVTALAGPGPEEATAVERAGLPMADIWSVGSEFAGRVLTRRTKLIGNAFAFAALLALFAGLGLGCWGGMMAFPDDKSAVSPAAKAIGITLLATGGVLFLSTMVFFFVNPNCLSNRYLLGVVRREFARRTGCVVDPNDPEALFVEVVPKLNWGKLMLDTASDVGFLKVDHARCEVLFEGDNERWRIPTAAIESCGVEVYVQGQGTHAATKIYYTVLRARRLGQFWEAPIRERGSTGMFQSGRRKRAAERLCAAINGEGREQKGTKETKITC